MNTQLIIWPRQVLVILVLFVFASGGSPDLQADDPAGRNTSRIGAGNRDDAVHRRRRVILNDDAGTVISQEFRTREEFLAHRFIHTVDTQVDSIWFSLMVGSEKYVYDCKVGDRIGKDLYPGADQVKGDADQHKLAGSNMNALLDKGTDPLREVVRFGHAHDKEVFASFRMNMIQDSWRPEFVTQWKRDHPDWCLGVRGMADGPKSDPRYLYWSGLDYARSEVHDQRVAVIRDISMRYDVDGMELDFWRWPMFFRSSLEGRPVGPEQIEIMNSFMRRVRETMNEIETARKRPLLLAVRVFDNLELSLKMGLDIKTWLEDGLIDILVVGGTYTYYSIPTTQWAQLAHQHQVPLYLCMYRPQGPERDRALATYHLQHGADGMYLFNWLRQPDEELPTLREIGDLQTMTGKDKHYVMNGSVGGIGFGHVTAPGLVPVRLEQGAWRPAILLIGDDVRAAAAAGHVVKSTLQVSLQDFLPEKDKLTVKLNGTQLESPHWEEAKVSFEVAVPLLTVGRNTIELLLEKEDASADAEVDVKGIELRIRYGED